MGFCDRNCVIFLTNRPMCTLNKEILDYSMTKVFLERALVELVYKFDEKSYCAVCKGESIAKVQFNICCPQTYIYI